MELDVRTTVTTTVARVIVRGEVDLETGPPLRDHLAATLLRAPELVLDLRGVTFIDSTGLQALVATRRRANLTGERFRLLVAPGGPVARILHLTGLDGAFEVDELADEPSSALPEGAGEVPVELGLDAKTPGHRSAGNGRPA